MKRKRNRNRGITLISLVITIVILIILASVSIAMLTGENGIIIQALKAQEEVKKAEALEIVKLAVLELELLDKNTNEAQLLADSINKLKQTKGKAIVTENSRPGFKYTIEYDEYIFDMDDEKFVRDAYIFNEEEWNKTALEESYFKWKSDDINNVGYNTIVGYTDKILNKTVIKFPSRTKEIQLSQYMSSGEARDHVKTVSELQFPETLEVIGDSAFISHNNLNKIDIPYGTQKIGSLAFGSCTSLADITIPDTVTDMNYLSFNNTLWEQNLSDGENYLGRFFYKYKGVMPVNTEIVIKEGTVGIFYGAFDGCRNLINITLPDGLISIHRIAFRGCSGLTNLVIPDSVKSIEHYAFEKIGITEVIIPKNVINIYEGIFYGTNYTINIKCRATEKPKTWSDIWNRKEANGNTLHNVEWGYTGE